MIQDLRIDRDDDVVSIWEDEDCVACIQMMHGEAPYVLVSIESGLPIDEAQQVLKIAEAVETAHINACNNLEESLQILERGMV